MYPYSLSENVQIKTVSENERAGIFEIEGLYGGYGLTIGNALRRVLLSSITGAAITQIKIKGANHEFTTIPGVLEDMVELMIQFKKVRFRLFTDESQTLSLKKKGEGIVTARDITTTSQVEVVNPDAHLVTLTAKQSEFDVELTVERGLGYVPAEMRKAEKLPIGVIALDAIFSPVTKMNFTVEHMRVGDRTDYDRLRFTIETDGSLSPSAALVQAAAILGEHFSKFTVIEPLRVGSAAASGEAEAKPKAKRARKVKSKEKEAEAEPEAPAQES